MARRKIRKALPPKKFFSMRTVRLTGLNAHTVIMPANKPKLLPEVLWIEAVRNGCMEFDPDLIKAAAAAALEAAEEADESSAAADPRSRIKRAVMQVAMLDDASAVTKDGVPKVAVVKRLVDNPDIQVTSDLVYDLYLELTDEGAIGDEEEDETLEDLEKRIDANSLNDPDGIDEPVGGGLAAVLEAANADGGLEAEE